MIFDGKGITMFILNSCTSIHRVMKRSIQLDNFGRQLLLALDKNDDVYRLSCGICTEFFDMDQKRPMKMCANSICQNEHSVCEKCLIDLKQRHRRDPNPEAKLICIFCKREASDMTADERKFDQVRQLVSINDLFRKIGEQSKKDTQEESEKKIKEVVERASREIFRSNMNKQRNDFLINHLRRNLKRTNNYFQEKISDLEQKERELKQRQVVLNNATKAAVQERMQLQKALLEKDEVIRLLKLENQRIRNQLREETHLEEIQSAVKKTKGREREMLVCEHGTIYRKFRFKPWKGEDFTDTFRERRPGYIIELRQERKAELEHRSSKRTIFDMNTFSADKEEDQLLYFEFVSANPKAKAYRFGLALKEGGVFKEIRYALVTMDIPPQQLASSDREFTIGCFINLATRKLYMTSGNLTVSQSIPQKVHLKHYCVFIYFHDWQTRIQIK